MTISPGYLLTRDRTKRVRKTNLKYDYADIIVYALVTYQELANNELSCYNEAMKSKYSTQWKQAMLKEIQSIHQNKTWDLVPIPPEERVVDCKWILKVKEGLTSA